MVQDMINGVIRAVLPAFLAFAVGKGWLAEGSIGDVTAAVVAVSAAGWSVWTKRPTQVIAAAAAIPAVEKIVAPKLADAIPSPKVVNK